MDEQQDQQHHKLEVTSGGLDRPVDPFPKFELDVGEASPVERLKKELQQESKPDHDVPDKGRQ